MANKMISEKDLRDKFLSSIIRSEQPLKAPPGFMDEVMNRISTIKETPALKPYKPPLWLKWGIPGIAVSFLMALLIWGPEKQPAAPNSGLPEIAESYKTINSWLSQADFDIHFPALNISGTFLWIIVGGMILTWSFLLLARFLDRRVRHR